MAEAGLSWKVGEGEFIGCDCLHASAVRAPDLDSIRCELEVGAWAVDIDEVVGCPRVDSSKFDMAVYLVCYTEAGGVVLGDGIIC